jgi:hypothetical protein
MNTRVAIVGGGPAGGRRCLRRPGSVIRGPLARRRRRSGPSPHALVPAEGMAGPASKATAEPVESSRTPHPVPVGRSVIEVIGVACPPEVAEWVAEGEEHRIGDVDGAEVGRTLGWADRAPHIVVIRHHGGIPQHDTGQPAWLSEVERLTEPTLHRTGSSYRRAGVSHLAPDAVNTDRAIIEAQ